MKAHRQLYTLPLLLPASLLLASCSAPSSSDGTQPSNPADDPNVAVATQADDAPPGPHVNAVTEAPTGFDNKTNGFNPNHLTAAALQAAMDATRDTFSEVEAFEDGMGPT